MGQSAYTVVISPIANGWIVEVGCLKLAFTDPLILTAEIGRWLGNPAEVEQHYREKYYGNGGVGGGPTPAFPPDAMRAAELRAYRGVSGVAGSPMGLEAPGPRG